MRVQSSLYLCKTLVSCIYSLKFSKKGKLCSNDLQFYGELVMAVTSVPSDGIVLFVCYGVSAMAMQNPLAPKRLNLGGEFCYN